MGVPKLRYILANVPFQVEGIIGVKLIALTIIVTYCAFHSFRTPRLSKKRTLILFLKFIYLFHETVRELF